MSYKGTRSNDRDQEEMEAGDNDMDTDRNQIMQREREIINMCNNIFIIICLFLKSNGFFCAGRRLFWFLLPSTLADGYVVVVKYLDFKFGD